MRGVARQEHIAITIVISDQAARRPAFDARISRQRYVEHSYSTITSLSVRSFQYLACKAPSSATAASLSSGEFSGGLLSSPAPVIDLSKSTS